MKGSKNYRVPKLKGSENYESWKKDITSALKVKGLWMIISEWLEKSEASKFNASTAATFSSTSAAFISTATASVASTAAAFIVLTAVRKEYVIAAHYWANKNDRVCDMIIYNCEKESRVHIFKINDVIKMWFILETQYEQSNLTTLYLIIKELNRSKQLNFKFIQNYVDSLKWIIIRCSNVEKTIESWLLSNLFLLDFNESLESYIFNLIQSIKINKFKLLIDEMTIALVDHDKRANEEKNLSFKSMMTQFDDKKRKFENNSEFQRESKKCAHCEQENHSEQSC